MNSEQTVCVVTKQDSITSSSTEEEYAAVRRFRSDNNQAKLKKDFYKLIRNEEATVAELESMIDICPDLLASFERNTKYTPLHIACLHGRSYEVVELLVRRNPDLLQIADQHGNLPLHHVNQFRSKSKFEEEFPIYKLMVDTYPLSVQVQNMNGKTPLHWYINNVCKSERSFQVIELMIQLHPQALQIKHKLGKTPFHIACCSGCSYEVMEFMIQQNPNLLQVADEEGNLPLHLVRQHGGDLSIIKLMVDTYPLSVQVQNTNGQTVKY